MNKNNLRVLLKKLNRQNKKKLLVFNAPREFLSVLWDIGHEIEVIRSLGKNEKVVLVLTFVRQAKEIEKYGSLINDSAETDAVIWFAFPKKTSKTYKSNIDGENGWDGLITMGFEKAGSISVDNDWSALRFKKLQKRQ